MKELFKAITYTMLVYTCIVFALMATTTLAKRKQSPKIVEGTPVNITQYPYQIGLYTNNFFMCGGSIVSELYIVTAAHCIKNKAGFTVRVGSSHQDKGGEKMEVEETFINENYDPPDMDSDIALVKLKKPLKFSDSVQPIKFNYNPILINKMVDITGYGNDKEGGKQTEQLMHINLPTMPLQKCIEIYADKPYKLTENMFCAGYLNGTKDSCQGDSGGPVAYKGTLIGIVSWGLGCAREGYPGLYTSIPKMKSFIESHMG